MVNRFGPARLTAILKSLLALGLFTGALWVLHEALGQFHYQHVLQQLRTIPATAVAAAGLLTVCSYLVMTAYDRLAVVYIHHPLDGGRVTLASFVSYAYSNSLGFSLLTGSSVRYRLYSAWGLSAEEIARLVAFTTLTFWLGIFSVGSILFIAEPLALPDLPWLPGHSALPLGLLCAALVCAYLLLVGVRRTPLHLRHWEIALPPLRLALLQLLIGAVDWALAGSVLYVLLPASAGVSLPQFLCLYLLAQIVALLSHVPGGMGVFESLILLTLPTVPAAALLGSLLVYRVVYYLLPLGLATLLLGGGEVLRQRRLLGRALRLTGRWAGVMIPQLLAASTLIGGVVLLFSGATPAVPGRMAWLQDVLPLPVIELSHFLGSLVGICLLLLARGLQRRLDAAYLLAALLLAAGSLLSLLKGGDYEEALLLGGMLAVLLPCRRHFYRRSSLLAEPFTASWIATILLLLASTIWLGLFAFKHVDYSSELWWRFAFNGDAPRFLRAAVGVVVLLLLLAVAKLLRPAPAASGLPGAEALQKAEAIVAQSPASSANLAFLGDKALLFDETGQGFVMYGVEGGSWIAMGDPVGPPAVVRELAWKFRELAERHGGQTVFYEVGTSTLHLYLDMGLTLLKIGEEAHVPLAAFSLDGQERKGLRYGLRRLEKEGCRFEILPAESVPALLPELQAVSDAWLEERKTREKGFSLGRFDADYLARFPLALVRREGEIVAFANLWSGAARQELSVDLMRYSPAAPNNVMEFLFVHLMLWGKEEGYQRFVLGMAPLAGLENRPFAPLWNRIGAVLFRHGEHFYHFEGLRTYKEKFDPVWEPRYLACPGGVALPRILLNIAALIGGGLKGVIGK